MTLAYAVHRLDGLVSPANAAYSASELEFQLKNSGAKALFTVRQAIPNSVYKPANACQKVYAPPRNVAASCKRCRNPEQSNLHPGDAQRVFRG